MVGEEHTGDDVKFRVLLSKRPQRLLRDSLRSSVHGNRVRPSHGDLLGNLKPVYKSMIGRQTKRGLDGKKNAGGLHIGTEAAWYVRDTYHSR